MTGKGQVTKTSGSLDKTKRRSSIRAGLRFNKQGEGSYRSQLPTTAPGRGNAPLASDNNGLLDVFVM
jgi:hypothetical protein